MERPGDWIIADRYLLHDVLGAGGMGVVYRATDLKRDAGVAVKLLHPYRASNTLATQRLAAEGRAGSRVHHPNVVAVLDIGTAAEGTPFLVMEHVRGRLLDQLIQLEGPVPLRRASAIVGQILAGLQALHDAGFVHGDVKSGNVMIDSANGVDAIKLIDLGLAHSPDVTDATTDATEQGMVSGTPEFMAPEVVRGDGVVPASDIYAAGVVCYQLLTGTTPFEGGTSREILRRHLDDVIVPLSLRCADRNIPSALEHAVMIALQKEPAARFATAAAFARALEAATPAIEPAAPPGEAWPAGSTRTLAIRRTARELPAPRHRASLLRIPASAATADTRPELGARALRYAKGRAGAPG